MDYEKLLNRAKEHIPTNISERKRFEMPKASSFRQGNKTVIKNFTNIANYLNRDSKHLLKYISKELATSGELEGNRAVFNGKFIPRIVQEKIEKYVKEFVQCRECKSHDTKIKKKNKFHILKCMACQAERTLPRVKK